MQKISKIIALISLLVMTGLGATAPVYADEWNAICNDPSLTDVQREAAGCDIDSATAENTATAKIKSIVGVALGVIGVVAVVVVVIAGIFMITANGNPDKIAKARQAIIFAIIGVIVALLAFAIVNFILDGIGGSTP